MRGNAGVRNPLDRDSLLDIEALMNRSGIFLGKGIAFPGNRSSLGQQLWALRLKVLCPAVSLTESYQMW